MCRIIAPAIETSLSVIVQSRIRTNQYHLSLFWKKERSRKRLIYKILLRKRSSINLSYVKTFLLRGTANLEKIVLIIIRKPITTMSSLMKNV